MPNLTVSLDVMDHSINQKKHEILVMIDHGDMLLRLKRIPYRRAITAFYAFLN